MVGSHPNEESYHGPNTFRLWEEASQFTDRRTFKRCHETDVTGTAENAGEQDENESLVLKKSMQLEAETTGQDGEGRNNHKKAPEMREDGFTKRE